MGLLNLCTNRETKISHIACFVLFFLSIIQVLILDSRAYLTNYKTHIELQPRLGPSTGHSFCSKPKLNANCYIHIDNSQSKQPFYTKCGREQAQKWS